jgi:hypothetical protein
VNRREAISTLYNVSARMVRGTYLSELGEAAEKQRTMRANVIEDHLDRIMDVLKDEAVTIKKVIDMLAAEDSRP